MKKFFWLFFIVLLLGIGGWVYYKYFMIYSTGERVGMLNKFSKKGNIFKTYEGILLMPGINSGPTGIQSNSFYFSVSDPSIADSLEKIQGLQVSLHYIQYHGSLPWRGDDYTENKSEQYIVDRIEKVSPMNNNSNSYGL